MSDKVVIITGAGQGIGKATAIRFAQGGYKVVVAELNKESGSRVTEEIGSTGGEAIFVETNITRRSSVQKLVEITKNTFHRIDVLINNAGIIKDATLKKMTDEDFDRVVEVNMKGTFLSTQAVAEVMRGQRSGVILNAASVVAIYGNFGQTNYVASKAGIIGMTKVWARELGKDGIRVNAIAPGFIETEMLKSIPQEVMQRMIERVPLKRMGKPEEIAALYFFLASEQACYITGAVIGVDGGVVV